MTEKQCQDISNHSHNHLLVPTSCTSSIMVHVVCFRCICHIVFLVTNFRKNSFHDTSSFHMEMIKRNDTIVQLSTSEKKCSTLIGNQPEGIWTQTRPHNISNFVLNKLFEVTCVQLMFYMHVPHFILGLSTPKIRHVQNFRHFVIV